MTAKYIVLMGDNYYPRGWDDFQGAFSSLDEVLAWVDTIEPYPYSGDGWIEIISTESWSVIKTGYISVSDSSFDVDWEESDE